jgi:hypothetical protein
MTLLNTWYSAADNNFDLPGAALQTIATGIVGDVTSIALSASSGLRVVVHSHNYVAASEKQLDRLSGGVRSFVFYTGTQLVVGQQVVFDVMGVPAMGFFIPANVQA